MDTSATDTPMHPGLLDISVELSSEQLFAGSEFMVYVILKNPFGRPLWVDEITVSVPSQMEWRKGALAEIARPGAVRETPEEAGRIDPALIEGIATHRARIEQLQREIKETQKQLDSTLADDRSEFETGLTRQQELLNSEVGQLLAKEQVMYGLLGYDQVTAIGDESRVYMEEARSSKPVVFTALGGAKIHLQSYTRIEDSGQGILLKGSLLPSHALQPGSTAVWEVRLATKSALFFLPAQYRLQFNVRYSFEPPPIDGLTNAPQRVVRVDTYGKTLTVRASMQAMMLGAFVGGIAGSLARTAQIGITTGNLIENVGTIFMRVFLSCVLSVAAVIFAARKSDIQAFISVEDFWGGALIGFLIGFSGTAAFAQITGTDLSAGSAS